MAVLPNDVARCPGHALIDMRTKAIYTDPRCEGCSRLAAARADTAQWVADGRPRIEGGRPSMPCAWMVAPYSAEPSAELFPCPARIEPHPAADERRDQEKSPTGCNRSGFPAA